MPASASYVTLLYADWSEFAQAPQASTALLAFLTHVENALADLPRQGGVLVARQEHVFCAAWGLRGGQEDAAEHAVRFALALREATRGFASGGMLPVKLAISSGEVEVDLRQGARESVSGPTVDLCRQMSVVMPDGGVALGQETFHKVEGLFNTRHLARLPVRGHPEPVDVYIVRSAKQIQFRIVQHDVEGVMTRLVGREIEVKRIRDAFEITTDERENHLVTLVGEAGMGKSRLMMDVDRWRETINDSTRLFRVRASPEMRQQPYGALREILMARFQLQESDAPAVAAEKMRLGVEQFMGPGHVEEAHMLMQLVGLPLPEGVEMDEVGGAALSEQRGLRSLAAFFRAVDVGTPRGVISIYVEDAQWADDKSLDAILQLLQRNVRTRLIAIVLTRPELLERRPRWGLELSNSLRIDLHALPVREARKLVREVLQKLPDLPDTLRDWIVERSGGNPLCIEELVRTLVNSGVLLKGTPGGAQDAGQGVGGQDAPWSVDLSRLEQVRVPGTLTGLLQVQLSNLPLVQRTALQRAAVVGRIFWDSALAALEAGDGMAVQMAQALAGLARRNLIFRQERSAFAGLQEYTFVSNLMYETAYGSIPAAVRGRYHALAGDWLARLIAGGDGHGAASQAGRIAEHYERAGQGGRAVSYLALAAEEARRLNAFAQALQFLERAVAHAAEPPPSPAVPGKAGLLSCLGETLIWMGEAHQAFPYLEQGLELARQSGNLRAMADLLGRLGWAGYYVGDWKRSPAWLEEAVDCARQAENRPALLLALRQLGNVASARGEYDAALRYYQESLEIARQLQDVTSAALALNNLGIARIMTGNYEQAQQDLQESIATALAHGDRMGAALAQGNLGIAAYLEGNYALALQHLNAVTEASQAVGSQLLMAETMVWLGFCAVQAGETETAQERLRAGLRLSLETEQGPLARGALAGFAMLASQQGQDERAVELLGATHMDEAMDEVIRNTAARRLLEHLRRALPRPVFEQAWARGQALDLEKVMAEYG